MLRSDSPRTRPPEALNPTLARNHVMNDAQKATEVSVTARSTEPLTGILQVSTADADIKFEITEDLAHQICTDLERFLTR